MAKIAYTVRTALGDERTVKFHDPKPTTITLSVTDECHNTGINADIDAECKKYGTPKTYTWNEANSRYEED